ncbi:MAG TPA: DUF6768 family protein [Thermoguttaceae bacterium]
MNEHIEPLKDALAQNGSFDPEKAKKVTAEVVSGFHARLQKTERLMWIYLILCTAVILYAFYKFEASTSTKSMIGFGILLLATYETTILMKLWYWIVNNKISVLKEIKLLQLEKLEGTAALRNSSVTDLIHSAKTPWRGLPRWERSIWFVSLIAIAIGVSIFSSLQYLLPLTLKSYVTLEADGSGESVEKISYTYAGAVPRTSETELEHSPTATSRWIDKQGRELAYDVSDVNGQKKYAIHLIEPVMPGEQISYTQISDDPKAATKNDDIWTYQGEHARGCDKNIYSDVVQLPPDAEIISVDPKPDNQYVSTGPKPDIQFTYFGRPTLSFKASRGFNETFKFTIKYRLPKEAAP